MIDYQPIYTEFVRKFKNDKLLKKRGIGVEMEIPVVTQNGETVNVSIIQELFKFLEKRGFQLKTDTYSQSITSASKINRRSAQHFDYHIDTIMTDAGASILEIVLAPQYNLHDTHHSFLELMVILNTYLDSKNCQMLGYGIQPLTPPSRKLLMPKERYFFYEKFSPNHIIPKSEGADAHLLTITASNQCHIDIGRNEAITAINVLNSLSGLQIILNANSPIWKGKVDQRLKASREIFWEYCYPDRINQMGIPPRFETLQEYFRFLLEFKPMLVKRKKLLKILNKATFKDFLLNKKPTIGETLEGQKVVIAPKFEDIHYHNTFCYFNARLAPSYGTIESRMCCQQPPNAALAPTALTLGILENLEKAKKLIKRHSLKTWKKIRRDAIQRTFKTTINGKSIIPLLTELLEIAKEGLKKRELGEEMFLEPLFERLKSQKSPADEAIEIFNSDGLKAFLAHYSFNQLAVRQSKSI